MANYQPIHIPIPKICSKCKKQKPLFEFSTHPTTKDKHDSYCKSCRHEQYLLRKSIGIPRLKYAATRTEYIASLNSGTLEISDSVIEKIINRVHTESKFCTSCSQIKSLSEYYVRICNGKHINFRQPCKECHNKITVASRKRSPKEMLSKCKKISMDRGFDFNLDIEFLQEKLSSTCEYCGEDQILMTIDRRDSSLGYTKTNCAASCLRCNLIKSDMPYDAWITISDSIRKARENGLFGNWIGRKNFNKRNYQIST